MYIYNVYVCSSPFSFFLALFYFSNLKEIIPSFFLGERYIHTKPAAVHFFFRLSQ
jgi:hypothetical protein